MRDIVDLRDSWRHAHAATYARICGGVAHPIKRRGRKPGACSKKSSLRAANKKRRTGKADFDNLIMDDETTQRSCAATSDARWKRNSTSVAHKSLTTQSIHDRNKTNFDICSSVFSDSEKDCDEYQAGGDEAPGNLTKTFSTGQGPSYAWSESRRPRTLAIYDRRCRLHTTKPQCVEQSRRAVAAASVVEVHALEVPHRLWVERRVSNEYVRRATALLSYAHDHSYCSELRRRCSDLETEATMLFGADDDDTSANRGTWDASIAATAAVFAAVDAVATGEAKNALCAVRPPGHHAGPALRAQGAPTNGYCVFNHAALGAKYAVHERGLRRVAVLDFDVHHGNGTEDALARTFDPSFLFISIHAAGENVFPGTGRLPEECAKDAQWNFDSVTHRKLRRSGSIANLHRFLDTGSADVRLKASRCADQANSKEDTPHRSLRSRRASEKLTVKVHSPHPGVVNLPMEPPPVTSDWLLRLALPRAISELERFGPELILLSSGFDAHRRDPVNLGRLDASDYGEITWQLLSKHIASVYDC